MDTLGDAVAEGLVATVSVAGAVGDQGPPECVDTADCDRAALVVAWGLAVDVRLTAADVLVEGSGDSDALFVLDGEYVDDAVRLAIFSDAADVDDGLLVRDPVVVRETVTVAEAVAVMRTDAVPDRIGDGLSDAEGVVDPVTLTELVRVGDVVAVTERDGGADCVVRAELDGLRDATGEWVAEGLPDVVLETVTVRVAGGLAVVVLEAEVVGEMERVTADEPVGGGLRVDVAV